MSDTVGFALLSGLAVGFILGIVFVAKILGDVDKNRIKRGLMEYDGVVYKITEISA